MAQVTISLTLTVEGEAGETLPLLADKVRQVSAALQALADDDPAVFVTLPKIDVPGITAAPDRPAPAPPDPFRPAMVG